MRRLAAILTTIVLGATVLATSATGDDTHTYFVELDNAFGMTNGSEVKVSGVPAGTVNELDINAAKRALLEIELSGDFSQLGEDTICSSEPQSLIAEYSLDCEPKGPPLADGGTIPVEQTRQTVQNDLVQNTLREPYKEQLRLIINEFGTGIVGNARSLNQAVRRGAPALRETREVLRLLGDQNELIRDLNVNSDTIFARLAEQRGELRRFLTETADISDATAERGADLEADFAQLDDFLAELDPTLVQLAEVTREQTPLLRDLRASAGGLNTLATRLPAFNEAAGRSLDALGDAAEPGERALRKGANEIRALRDGTKSAFGAADSLAKFFEDLDDPGRAVEVDERAARDSGRPEPTGYTGLEGLLNYVYYQPGAINQFTNIGHALHISIFDLATYPCFGYNAGGEPGTPEFGVPSADGGHTTDILEAHRCVSWLGPNQPGINTGPEIPPYDPSVCPQGSDAPELCNPVVRAQDEARKAGRRWQRQQDEASGESDAPDAVAPPDDSPAPKQGGGLPDLNETLGEILDLPGNLLGGGRRGEERGGSGGGGLLGGGGGGLLGGGGKQSSGGGAEGLLDFLFGS